MLSEFVFDPNKPFLPGNTGFGNDLQKKTFNKPHHFDRANDVLMWVGEKKPGIGYEPLPGQKKEHYSQFPPGSGEVQPAWIAYDKRVLAFDGFFEEVVINNNSEAFRIRPVKVYFYLEDDTIQVNEPLVENSGLSQGKANDSTSFWR